MFWNDFESFKNSAIQSKSSSLGVENPKILGIQPTYRRFLKSNSYKWVEAQTAVNPKLAPLELKEILQACIRNKHHDISTVRKKSKRRQSGELLTSWPILTHIFRFNLNHFLKQIKI